MTGSVVTLDKVLHLKSGVAYLENNNLAATGEFLSKQEFQKFNILKIDDDESLKELKKMKTDVIEDHAGP